MPLLILGKPSDFVDKEDFHARMDHHEAYFIDVAKTLSPPGYNVRNRATARRKRESHAVRDRSSPNPNPNPSPNPNPDPDPNPNPNPDPNPHPDDPPSPPPLSPQWQLLAGRTAAPALGVAQGGRRP